MMISLHSELQNLSMRTLGNVLGCTQGLHGMGLIVAIIQQVLFLCCNMNGIELLHLTNRLREMNNFWLVWSSGVKLCLM